MLKYILKNLFPFLKFTDADTWRKKIIATLDSLVALLVYGVMIVYFGAGLLYPYEYKFNNHIAVYTADKLNQIDAKKLLSYQKNAWEAIHNDQLYNDRLDTQIYLMNNNIFYTLFTPLSEIMEFGSSIAAHLGKKSAIRMANIQKNKAYSLVGTSADLDAVLAHETIHQLQTDKGYTPWYLPNFLSKTPTWVREGYAVYSEMRMGKERQKDFDILVKEQKFTHLASHQEYALWGMMVKHAIEDMNISVDDLHRGKVDYDTVFDSLMKKQPENPL
jgi:hypothetical protein